MTERTSDRKDLAAVLAFIPGLLSADSFRRYRHSHLIVDNDPERVATHLSVRARNSGRELPPDGVQLARTPGALAVFDNARSRISSQTA